MAFTTSNISAAAVLAMLTQNPTGAGTVSAFYSGNNGVSYAADTIMCALYGNSGTPDKNATLANNTYAAGAWITGTSGTNEIWQAVQWPQGGIALGTKTNTFSSGTVQIGAASVVSGAAATLAPYGCLVYDSTLTTKYAYCWNFFGAASVTAGTFTVVWSGNGIMQFTIT